MSVLVGAGSESNAGNADLLPHFGSNYTPGVQILATTPSLGSR